VALRGSTSKSARRPSLSTKIAEKRSPGTLFRFSEKV
jgi:hypothetical protein